MSKNSEMILAILQTPPPIGGAALMNENLLKALKENNRNIYHIIPGFARNEKERGKQSLYKILRLGVLILQVSIKYIILKPKIVITELSSNKSAFLKDVLLTILPLLTKKRIYYYLHMSNMADFYSNLNKYLQSIFHFVVKGNTKFIVLSNNIKDKYKSIIPEDQLIVMENGIDFPKYHLKRKECQDTLNCLHLSILMKDKGYLKILDVAKKLKGKNVRFVIAGPDGPDFDEDEFKRIIHEEQLEDIVIRKKAVFGMEKEELFANSDIFLFPSSFAVEAFPLVLLEALSYGLYIIASKIGAIPEIVEHNSNGYLVSSGNADEIIEKIQELIDNKEYLDEVRKNNIQKFSLNYSLFTYKNKINSVIQ